MKTENPQVPERDFLEPSPEFKSNAAKVIFAIVAFVLIYLVLVALSLALLAASVAMGIGIIFLKASFITLIIGLGLVGFGVMVVAFLIKFIFARSVDSDAQRIEITMQEEPELFAFVNKIADDVGTHRPKKIFLSPDVNAAVFYNSSFFSMFLPVKKNLNIGLGLVNSVNKSEFKAVIAHEFGHFSQRSMKLGSYVYTTNKVIYNLLYDNDGWNNMLISFAKIHSIMNLFARLTVALANGIRYILIKVYEWIQLVYMALSREMEYHADLVAVSQAGNSQMINSLRRIEFGTAAYDYTTTHLDKLAQNSSRCKNVYTVQSRTIGYLCELNHLSVENGLPVITDEELDKRKTQSKIIIKDQWASHPTRADREANINQWQVNIPVDNSSPWTLFANPEDMQQKMTEHIYAQTIPKSEGFAFVSVDELFDTIIATDKEKTTPEKYEGYYSGRVIDIKKVSDLDNHVAAEETFDAIYTEEFQSKVASLLSLLADQNILQNIADKKTQVKSFDYDGRKYKLKDTKALLDEVTQKIERTKNEIKAYDTRALQFYLKKAEGQNKEGAFKDILQFHLSVQNEAVAFNELVGSLVGVFIQLQSQSEWSEEALIPIHENLIELKGKYENLLEKASKILVPASALPEKITAIGKYLLDEPIAELQTTKFDYSWFVKLYGQVAGSSQRMSEVWEYSYARLLNMMDRLPDN